LIFLSLFSSGAVQYGVRRFESILAIQGTHNENTHRAWWDNTVSDAEACTWGLTHRLPLVKWRNGRLAFPASRVLSPNRLSEESCHAWPFAPKIIATSLSPPLRMPHLYKRRTHLPGDSKPFASLLPTLKPCRAAAAASSPPTDSSTPSPKHKRCTARYRYRKCTRCRRPPAISTARDA
jgi:hypothetical protein